MTYLNSVRILYKMASSIFWWNRVAYTLHLVSAVTMIILTSTGVVNDKRDQVMLNYQYTSWENSTLTQKYEDAYSIRISWLIASFSLLSFVFQCAVDIASEWYDGVVNDQQPNPVRFVEYSLSAPMMFICICVLSGIRNAHLIASLAVLVSVTMWCGLVAEWLLNRYTQIKDLAYYRVGLVAHFAGWFTICTAYGIIWASTAVVLTRTKSNPPDYVWAIIITQCVLFLGFGLIQVVQFIQQRISKYDEPAYIALSLTAKLLLAWLIFASVLV